LAAKPLHAKTLRVRIAPVTRRTRALLMCHLEDQPSRYLMPVTLTRVSSWRWPWRLR
jgi:hypothetical protein